MDILEVLEQVRELLQQKGRITYRILKRQFALDDEALEDLKDELIEAERVAADENGKVLVWTGGEMIAQPPAAPDAELPASVLPAHPEPEAPAADRRQLTIMFCDLVGSTPMSAQLDPEDYRDIMQAYQEMCGQVLTRFTGHIARYEGDGILVYFGYPQAQEDAAAQAVRAGLQIIAGLPDLNARFQPRFPLLQEHPLQVRVGLHTGLVVVGEMGSEQYRIDIAVGETPNMAARIQGQAGPNEIMISAATQRLVAGLFKTEDRGCSELKGISTLQSLYRVVGESGVHSRFEVARQTELTPLVGRETELNVLYQRWQHTQAGHGEAVLISGEPGIGKSRLVQELTALVTGDGAMQREFRCSPYQQNSAFYPITEHLQRRLQFTSQDMPETKLAKLQRTLSRYRFPQVDTFSLLAALLSLPHPDGAPPLTMSPEKQKERTQAALVAWLVEETEQTPVFSAWEDVHWADPSTLEVLALLLNQVPTVRLLAVITFRSEFVSPWGTHSYLSHLTLRRLEHPQVSVMVERVTGGKPLPAEVLQQIVTKTDGVPLFVEELTKMVIESSLVRAVNNHYELTGPLPPLAIPATLQDSLMARLDRLATAREVAQLGATIGREFSYTLLQAVSALDEVALEEGLRQLVEAELIFQRGLPPQADYLFKHALVQDTAYQSLLKSKRQQSHQQIARALEEQFPETTQTQPELVAHHYTEAGLAVQAIPYWQRAGQRAIERSAYEEAVNHLMKGLEVLQVLAHSPERDQQEFFLQAALGQALAACKGFSAPGVENAYARALELGRRVGETPQLFPVLVGLWFFYHGRREFQTAGRELAEQMMRMAQHLQDPNLLIKAHLCLGLNLFWGGEFAATRTILERGLSFDDSQQPSILDRVNSLLYASFAVWHLGYPDRARKMCEEALASAKALAHPYELANIFDNATWLYILCRDWQRVCELAETAIALSTEHGFPYWAAWGTIQRGLALAEQGQGEGGRAQIQQGLATFRAVGAELPWIRLLPYLAIGHARAGQVEAGLSILPEAWIVVANEEHLNEVELHRLQGELTLQNSNVPDPRAQADAEGCFHTAIEVAQRQQAKSLEMRATLSLARLWLQQGKPAETRALLASVYDWFTEGFDTKDLQDAKALLYQLDKEEKYY